MAGHRFSGSAMMLLCRQKEAVEEFAAAFRLRRDPDDGILLGDALFGLKEYEKAGLVYSEVLEKAPTDVQGWHGVVIVRGQLELKVRPFPSL